MKEQLKDRLRHETIKSDPHKPVVIHGNFRNQEKARIVNLFETSQVLQSSLPNGLQVPEKNSNPDVYNALITHQNISQWVCAQCLSVCENLESQPETKSERRCFF